MLPVDATGLIHHCSRFGVTLIIPEGAIEQTATVRFGVCLLSDKFKFEGDFIPVSPIVWVYIDCQLIKPAELYIPHHIDVSNVKDPNSQLVLLTADEKSFIRDNVFTFKQCHEHEVTIESTSVKIHGSHFCTNCIAVTKNKYKKIPKRYLIIQADKILDDGSLFVDFCLLYQQEKCKEVIHYFQCTCDNYCLLLYRLSESNIRIKITL